MHWTEAPDAFNRLMCCTCKQTRAYLIALTATHTTAYKAAPGLTTLMTTCKACLSKHPTDDEYYKRSSL